MPSFIQHIDSATNDLAEMGKTVVIVFPFACVGVFAFAYWILFS
jgi:hypothetical protein